MKTSLIVFMTVIAGSVSHADLPHFESTAQPYPSPAAQKVVPRFRAHLGRSLDPIETKTLFAADSMAQQMSRVSDEHVEALPPVYLYCVSVGFSMAGAYNFYFCLDAKLNRHDATLVGFGGNEAGVRTALIVINNEKPDSIGGTYWDPTGNTAGYGPSIQRLHFRRRSTRNPNASVDIFAVGVGVGQSPSWADGFLQID